MRPSYKKSGFNFLPVIIHENGRRETLNGEPLANIKTAKYYARLEIADRRNRGTMKYKNAAAILRDLFESFPPLDPASEFFDEGVNACDVIDWISENAAEIRQIIDKEI